MSYLSREASTLSDKLWEKIDSAVIDAARRALVGRRFLHIFGPLGVGVNFIAIDDVDEIDEVSQDGIIITKGRRLVEIPTIYDDFTLLAKDLEHSDRMGFPVDLSRAMAAAEACSLKEDRLIFFGDSELGYEGLLTAQGINRISKKEWAEGENAFTDVVSGMQLLTENGIYGPYALVVSLDLYTQLQRLQPGTGLLEIDRISKLVDGRVFKSPVLGKNKAILVCPESRNMDLVIGQDMAAAYLEQKELNHVIRILETVLLRIKRKKAIVVFE
ncbi:family 1 encapsulin nanocompartment shell protein [Lutispora thermophila]|uniref:Type 1 encapsulin shell protein n=1 Tax=Lutispora thermophila DSM 19022 TaxID=1122184 RepID=A0A1M6HCU7_9FIRM|nr:family 1 encapsulin nanocompartment shell protein [Lutispora thermophila]SHJ19963.1 Uncharacterized protein, linocin/CFP29 family [Lutispora thermophila DSM 19022]